jgi:hypothetical protein
MNQQTNPQPETRIATTTEPPRRREQRTIPGTTETQQYVADLKVYWAENSSGYPITA